MSTAIGKTPKGAGRGLGNHDPRARQDDAAAHGDIGGIDQWRWTAWLSWSRWIATTWVARIWVGVLMGRLIPIRTVVPVSVMTLRVGRVLGRLVSRR